MTFVYFTKDKLLCYKCTVPFYLFKLLLFLYLMIKKINFNIYFLKIYIFFNILKIIKKTKKQRKKKTHLGSLAQLLYKTKALLQKHNSLG